MPRRKTKRKSHKRYPVPKRNIQTNMLFRKLPYTYPLLALSQGVAAIPATVAFRANSMYDPYVPVGGDQPRGFDQYMTMYDHFVVLGAKITIDYTGSGSNPFIVGCYISDNVSGPVDTVDCLERSLVKYGTLDPQANTRRIVMKINPNKFLGVRDPLSESKVEGSSGSNPPDAVYFHLFMFRADGGIGTGIQAQVRIEYSSAFKEPKFPAQS